MIRVGVPGVTGRMGAAVAQQVLQAADLQLTVVAARPDNVMVGTKLANSDIVVDQTIHNYDFDVLIDFTLPDGVIDHLNYCLEKNIAMVIGSTGFSDQQVKLIKHAATKIPILFASNMSLGVNICYKVLADVAKYIDKSWHISVSDLHHIHKKDTPSGTAKQLAAILAASTKRDITDIKITSVRQGETIGEHTVVFDNLSEKIVISHIAQSRDIYAKGAVAAARWICGKKPGLYSMQDVIL